MKTGIGLWRAKFLYQGTFNEGPKLGYKVAFEKAVGRLQFLKAADQLPAAKVRTGDHVHTFHFLTGKIHRPMTAFCTYSLMKSSEAPVRCVFHSDDTVDQETCEALRAVLPNAVFVSPEEINDKLEAFLPRNRFPNLRQQREKYKHLRKLTDSHSWSPGWNITLDSDLLFYRHPQWLLDWERSETTPGCMVDYQDSYGYSSELLASILDYPMPARVNVGICGLDGHQVDWDQLEYWTKTLLEKSGPSYFLEQTLIAMWLGRGKFLFAPEKDYIIRPDDRETRNPTSVMHHYVEESRTPYYRHAWRKFAFQ